ncbi:MAG: DUF1365 domain-containing protein [Halieaceae bacterium]
MSSAIYEGWVRHRRKTPKQHQFQYRVFMAYLRLDELPQLFDKNLFWSARRPALAWFRRSDFLGDPALPLDSAVRERVFEETGHRPQGPIYLLANLRYFGFIINPISCYYCYSEDGSQLEYLVAEVNNTPWDERHSYVLSAPKAGGWLKTRFAKEFHVSPFNPMDMEYHWHSNEPGEKLCLHMANSSAGEKVFDATLSMQRHELNNTSLNRFLWRYPMMTAKVVAAIYWQAMRLWLKGLPFYSHPSRTASITNE